MARTIGFLGPLGTYSEEASLLHDKTADRQYPTITGVGEAVAAGEVDEGVVPIENSLEGPVTFTLDLLIAQPTLFIRGEIDLPIEHYLLAKPGTDPAEIKVIYSHPQALAQCRQYLEKNYPQAEQMASLEKDSPGLLHRVLGEFADRDINLLKIESRPTKQLLGEYIFLLDCVGHREESPMKEALAALSDPISMLRVLGSYPRWKSPS